MNEILCVANCLENYIAFSLAQGASIFMWSVVRLPTFPFPCTAFTTCYLPPYRTILLIPLLSLKTVKQMHFRAYWDAWRLGKTSAKASEPMECRNPTPTSEANLQRPAAIAFAVQRPQFGSRAPFHSEQTVGLLSSFDKADLKDGAGRPY